MPHPYSTIPPNSTNDPFPFRVSIPESQLSEMATLLQLSKIPAPTYESLQEDGRFGVTHKWLTEAKDYYLNHFSWFVPSPPFPFSLLTTFLRRECEAHINSFPHFKVPISNGGETLDIHFVALFSEQQDAIPILLLHGWPGSFLEFLPILNIIKSRYTPATLPYHLIVPSLPGYAFSQTPPLDHDFQIQDVARFMNQLMLDLGFGTGYVVQGGDIGSKVARVLAAEHEACKAVHLNFGIMLKEPRGIDERSITDGEKIGLQRAEKFKSTGSAYALLHATRPSTISFALASSPLALLAWIGEKFQEWTDDTPSLDMIVESVSLYWLTETFPRAIYPYRQLFTPGIVGAHENPKWYIGKGKKLGFSWFPKEIAPVPRAWVETSGELVWWRSHTKGGHFAAVERSEVLLKDLEDFVGEVWQK